MAGGPVFSAPPCSVNQLPALNSKLPLQMFLWYCPQHVRVSRRLMYNDGKPLHTASSRGASRQYFYCLGLEAYCLGVGLDHHSLGFGLALTALVLCLETKSVQDM